MTIGVAPRDDLVPELLTWVGRGVVPVERGALDGLDEAAIAALAPKEGEARLVTRRADGSEAVLSASFAHERVSSILREMDDDGLDALVLLCTGHFPAVRLETPFISSQAAVDHGTLAVVSNARRIGVVVPHPEQARAVESRSWPYEVHAAHANPYDSTAEGMRRFEAVGATLSEVDAIVMHCMGYDEAMRAWVHSASQRPTLLARRLVGSALRQILP